MPVRVWTLRPNAGSRLPLNGASVPGAPRTWGWSEGRGWGLIPALPRSRAALFPTRCTETKGKRKGRAARRAPGLRPKSARPGPSPPQRGCRGLLRPLTSGMLTNLTN